MGKVLPLPQPNQEMTINATTVEQALNHLRKNDSVMASLIERVGPFTLKLEQNGFRMLVRSILSQQLSTKAAWTIRRRLERMLSPRLVTPQNLNALTVAQLRSVGVSKQKASYLKNISDRALSREINFRTLSQLSDNDIISELSQIKGIGPWTAKMFLIFSLGRTDVFPHEDQGIRAALRNLYQLPDFPDRTTSNCIAKRWRPYASIACWYCWRSLDSTEF